MQLTEYLTVLRKNTDFKKLMWAEATSQLGDWFNTIALMGFVYSKTQSGLMISLMLIAQALPGLLLSPFSGVLSDRLDKKTIMVYSDIARAIIALTLLLAGKYFLIIFLVKISLSIASIFFTPAKQATIPLVVNKEELLTANSLSSSLWGLMGILGASLGGLAIPILGYELAFILNSISFIISAIFISTCEINEKDNHRIEKRFFEEVTEGYKLVITTPILLALVLVGTSWGVVGGAYQILLTVYGAGVFNAGEFGIGTLYTVQGLGVLIGGLTVNWITQNNYERMKTVFGWSYLAQGLLFICFVFSPNLLIGAFFLFIMRIVGGFIIPLDITLIQKYTPENHLGKVTALHTATYGSVMQVSMFTTGLLLEKFSPQIVGSSFGAICLLASVTWLYLLKKGRLD